MTQPLLLDAPSEPPVEDLIQLMRLCSMAKIRKALDKLKKKDPEGYKAIFHFYKTTSK
jgi:hypothetical protein